MLDWSRSRGFDAGVFWGHGEIRAHWQRLLDAFDEVRIELVDPVEVEQVRQLPADRVHTVRLEELVLTRREQSLAALLEFLELDEDRGIRRVFDSELTAENGHLGRWRAELAGGEREELDPGRDVLAAMAADGVASRPDRDPLPADYAAVPAAGPGSAIDPWGTGALSAPSNPPLTGSPSDGRHPSGSE